MELSSRYRVFDLTTFILAVLAIVFAVIQFFDSKALLRKMQDALGSMSTAHIGGFPDNMNEIIRVTSDAQKHLDIMTDFVGYGSYSKPEKFDAYMAGLQRVAGSGVKIRVIVYTRAAREAVLREQFPIGDFENEKKQPRYARYFDVYHKNLGLPTTYELFIGALSRAEEEDVTTLARTAEIRHVRDKLPFYLWLQDDREAIFSFFQTTGAQAREPSFRELSFRTRDAS